MSNLEALIAAMLHVVGITPTEDGLHLMAPFVLAVSGLVVVGAALCLGLKVWTRYQANHLIGETTSHLRSLV